MSFGFTPVESISDIVYLFIVIPRFCLLFDIRAPDIRLYINIKSPRPHGVQVTRPTVKALFYRCADCFFHAVQFVLLYL